MVDLKNLKIENALRWNNAKLTRNFSGVAKRLVDPAAKQRYKNVSNQTGVPWAIIAVIHEREASQDWTTQLGQGDPLNRVSTHIPRGRGPFSSWEEGAFDALVNCAPFAAKWTDWTYGGAMTLLEQYNGLGYAARGVPSPYIWAGTDQYKSGKYVRDGVYDPNVIDAQLGCAGLLKTMMQLDATISFGKDMPTVQLPVTPVAIQTPVAPPQEPANNSSYAVTIVSRLKSLRQKFLSFWNF